MPIVSIHETYLVKENGKHLLLMESSISVTQRNPILDCMSEVVVPCLLTIHARQQHLMFACNVKSLTLKFKPFQQIK